MVTPGDFDYSDQGSHHHHQDEDETRGNSPEKKRHSGHNAGNDAKHSKLLAEITKLMQQPHPITGHRPYVGVMVDKVTDASTKQFQCQCLSYAHRGRRKLSLTDLRLVKDQAEPVAGEQALAAAGGRACFDKMVRSLDVRCGIDLHSDLENGQTIQMISVSTDGESCYSGRHSGLFHYLGHADGAGDPTIS